MKSQWKFLMALFVAVALVTACDEEPGEVDPNDPTSGEFSELTVEENKASLEQTGLDMLAEMEAMEESQAVEASAAMLSFAETSDPFEGNPNMSSDDEEYYKKKEAVLEPVVAVAGLQQHSINYLFTSTKSIMEDPESIQEAWDMLVGVYAWDATNEIWTYTDTGNEIRFEFPSTEEGTTNDASFVVKDYEGYTGPNPIDDEYTGDLPENITAELSVGSTVLMSFNASATYDASGYPTNITFAYTIDSYTFTVQADNSQNTSVEASMSWKKNDEVLMAFSAGLGGNWSESNIDANTVTEADTGYVWEYNWETGEYYQTDQIEWIDEWTWVKIWNVVQNGNASFQIMDVALVGNADFQKFGEAVYDWDEQDDENMTEQELEDAANDLVEVVNENIQLVLKYVDNNTIIAVAEAYPYSYSDERWNPDTEEYESYTNYDLDLRLVFADESKIDIETYFDEGFEDLFNEFEDFVNMLEDKYFPEEEYDY